MSIPGPKIFWAQAQQSQQSKQQEPKGASKGADVDITSSSNSKETTKLQAIEEGGMVSNLCEDVEPSKSITPKKTPPQAPDMSPEANGH